MTNITEDILWLCIIGLCGLIMIEAVFDRIERWLDHVGPQENLNDDNNTNEVVKRKYKR